MLPNTLNHHWAISHFCGAKHMQHAVMSADALILAKNK